MNAPTIVTDFIFKSKPFKHQEACFLRSRDLEAYGIFFKMGLGKSKVVIDTATYLYGLGRIDALVILAPNGVHRKWLTEDVPLSLPDSVEHCSAIWQAGNDKAIAKCHDLLTKRGHMLKILVANTEALSYAKFPEYFKKFLQSHRCLVAVDESTHIKSPDSKRTKALYKLAPLMPYRRILTGTSVVQSPFDLYGQFCFLDPMILGQSYYAFKNTYGVMLDPNDPKMKAIAAKLAGKAKRLPAIVEKDEEGNDIYRNLDKLKTLIAPYCMIVDKKDALDLPPKTYVKHYYDLDRQTRLAYDTLKSDCLLQLKDSTVSVLHKMVLITKLHQLVLGFVNDDERKTVFLHEKPESNPRIVLLQETLEDIEGQVIIWASHIGAIRQIMSVLGGDAVSYFGQVTNTQRSENLELFTSGKVKYLVGTPTTGGIGLNMVNSSTVVYYSNGYSYKDRIQSEDRVHRIGQTADNVLYIDLVANGTVDFNVLEALKRKQNLADYLQQSEGIDYR